MTKPILNYKINEEVIVDNFDCGVISFLYEDEREGFYIVESEITGSTYVIEDEFRLQKTNR